MEEDTARDERRYSGRWKKIHHRMKGDTVVEGRTQHRMKGDTVVGGRRHKIGWKGIYIQWWMEEDTAWDERRYSSGWKDTQQRMQGDRGGSIQWWRDKWRKGDRA